MHKYIVWQSWRLHVAYVSMVVEEWIRDWTGGDEFLELIGGERRRCLVRMHQHVLATALAQFLMLWTSGLWYRAVWYVGTDISTEDGRTQTTQPFHNPHQDMTLHYCYYYYTYYYLRSYCYVYWKRIQLQVCLSALNYSCPPFHPSFFSLSEK